MKPLDPMTVVGMAKVYGEDAVQLAYTLTVFSQDQGHRDQNFDDLREVLGRTMKVLEALEAEYEKAKKE